MHTLAPALAHDGSSSAFCPDEVHDFLVREHMREIFEMTDDFFLLTMIRRESVRVAEGGRP